MQRQWSNYFDSFDNKNQFFGKDITFSFADRTNTDNIQNRKEPAKLLVSGTQDKQNQNHNLNF